MTTADPTTSYKFGRLPAHPDQPRLRLAPYLDTAALPATPAVVDWVSKIRTWPMYGNDSIGDCVFAAIGHALQAASTYGQGVTVTVTDADIINAYSAVTGYNPADPDSDRGTVVQNALGYWRKTGIGGHRILAFAEVNHRDLGEVDAALNLFGHLIIGVDFPHIGMRQFNHHQPWDVVDVDGGSAGGHAVTLGADSNGQWTATSWGRTQPVTAAWLTRYCEEAWVVVSPEWLTAAGTSPAGLDLHGLGDALQQLTGAPNPFPSADPDRALADKVRAWAGQRHTGASGAAAAAVRAWLAAKGL